MPTLRCAVIVLLLALWTDFSFGAQSGVPANIITTVAGNGQSGFGGDGGPAGEAMLNSPGSVAVDFSPHVSPIVVKTVVFARRSEPTSKSVGRSVSGPRVTTRVGLRTTVQRRMTRTEPVSRQSFAGKEDCDRLCLGGSLSPWVNSEEEPPGDCG
jgi:hypothetical protein